MSTSQHPIALRLEELVGGQAKLLATVMLLPLIDGIFPALVLANALDSPAGIVQVGLLIFGGSATVAVILADFDGTPRESAKTVLIVGVPLVILAAVEAALAPAIESVLNLMVFERFAALVIVAVAASTASARIAEYMPRPAVIVGLGFVASIDPAGADLAVTGGLDPVLRGMAAGLVGVGFALGVAVASPWLHGVVDIDRFRFGSAVALGLLGVGIFPAFQDLGLIVSDYAPLIVLGIAGVFALDPSDEGTEADVPEGTVVDAATDGGATEDDEDADGPRDPPHERDPERAPWL